MIKLLNGTDGFELFSDICAVKIRSLALAYGFETPFCRYWMQYSESGRPLVLITKLESAVTLSFCGNSCNNEELTEFLSVIGYSELVCNPANFQPINAIKTEITAVSKAVNSTGANNIVPDINFFKSCYDIFSFSGGDIVMPEFEYWYTDISHRVRHGAAFVHLCNGGAAAVLYDGRDALINGISVLDCCKEKGIGTEIINKIPQYKPINKVFAFSSNSVLPFYIKNGFTECGKYAIYVLSGEEK